MSYIWACCGHLHFYVLLDCFQVNLTFNLHFWAYSVGYIISFLLLQWIALSACLSFWNNPQSGENKNGIVIVSGTQQIHKIFNDRKVFVIVFSKITAVRKPLVIQSICSRDHWVLIRMHRICERQRLRSISASAKFDLSASRKWKFLVHTDVQTVLSVGCFNMP